MLLHGDAHSVPGFRWFDKARGRTMVCSSPTDVAEIEAELSTGRGLLADGGVSVSDLLSGDATIRALTMSDARLPAAQRGAASFMASRTGFGRSLMLMLVQMARGAPVIFVDFVDYDEVAHHAGPSRPETMRTLENLDRVLGFFGSVASEVSRDYEIVVLSDHGQAQGSTFRQLNGA